MSSLVEIKSQTRVIECDQHGEFTAKVVDLCGHEHVSRCPECQKIQDKESEKKEAASRAAQRSYKVSRIIGSSGLPKRFLTREFDNYNAESAEQKLAEEKCRAFANRFEEQLKNGGGLIFIGVPGTGKTHLAAAIANQIMRTGRTVAFQTVLKAIRKVKSTYSKNSSMTEQESLSSFAAPDLLILDEVGVQRGTDTEQMILFEIINERYEQFRPTILISNLTLEEIKGYLGERNIDRMREGGGDLIVFDWDSYRSKVHKDSCLPVAKVNPVDWSK